MPTDTPAPAPTREPLRLRQGPEGAASTTARPDTRPGPEADRGRVLACARCARPITTTAARVEVGGAHQHTFVNPHGFAFHIGCFSTVTGCAVSGEPSTFWTWFPGYAWQVEGCRTCDTHLGWRFVSNGHAFHGLILDRLVEARS